MLQPIDQPVSVITKYDSITKKTTPVKFKWNKKIYEITKLGFYHHYKEGSQLFHVFEGVTDSFFFRLNLDAQTLHWKLEKISDDETN